MPAVESTMMGVAKNSSCMIVAAGHADIGIKEEFFSCCIKRKFYATFSLLHKEKFLCQTCLAVQIGRLLCERMWLNVLIKLNITKEKFLCQTSHLISVAKLTN